MKNRTAVLVVLFVCACSALAYLYTRTDPAASTKTLERTEAPAPQIRTFVSRATYQCAQGATIDATYFEGTSTPPSAPDMPPTPGGSVDLVLSDGRTLQLRQTLSASGIRYSDGDPMANGSEHVVFWSKGDTAFMTEDDATTYGDCTTKGEE